MSRAEAPRRPERAARIARRRCHWHVSPAGRIGGSRAAGRVLRTWKKPQRVVQTSGAEPLNRMSGSGDRPGGFSGDVDTVSAGWG